MSLKLDAVIPAFEEALLQPNWAAAQLRDLLAGIFSNRLAHLGEQVRMRDLHAALIDRVDQCLGEAAVTAGAAGILVIAAGGQQCCLRTVGKVEVLVHRHLQGPVLVARDRNIVLQR